MSITRIIQYRFKCEAIGCNNTHIEEFTGYGDEYVSTDDIMPRTWKKVNGTLYCPEHVLPEFKPFQIYEDIW